MSRTGAATGADSGATIGAELTDDEIALRAGAQAVRRAARQTARQAADPADLPLTRAERKAARGAAEHPGRMTGWVTPGGVPIPEDTELGLAIGAVAAGAAATTPVTPGASYVAAATVTGRKGWVGLQWINLDGTPGAITWGAGPGRVVVSAVAPDTAAAAQILLVAYGAKAADLVGKDQGTKDIQRALRDWLRATRNGDDSG